MEHDRAIDHDGRHPIIRAVADLTDRVIAERVRINKGFTLVPETELNNNVVVSAPRQRVQVLPPIQIKGLAADVMTVKRGFADIREIVRDVNMTGAALKQDLLDVRDQLHKHREDIRFEAETLGNAGETG